MEQNLSEEQKKDVQERVEKAIATLKELEVTVGINPIWVHTGKGAYDMQLITQYVDLKYQPVAPEVKNVPAN